MTSITISFFLTIFAGLSTLLGCIPMYLKNTNNKLLIGSLAFASGVMLTVSILDLIPESFIMINSSYYSIPCIIIVIIFILLGYYFSSFFDKFLIMKEEKIIDKKLYKTGMISLIAIILHNIPEGIITFLTSSYDLSLGISLTLAIILHNIPEGISISIPIYYSTQNRKKAFLYTSISALSEPLGALISYCFLSRFINNFILGILFSFIAGLMINISLMELLPTSFSYKQKESTLTYFLLGIITMLISLIFI